MPITGHATLEGTTHYRERFKDHAANNHYRLEQNLWLSSIGLGTYLGNADQQTDQRYTESISRAVQLGANVIDSASNYRFQRSERSIGEALRSLIDHGFGREELVLCTKGGYLPFDDAPPRDVRRYVEETFVTPGIADFSDIVGGSHCMTPAYLQNQLDQSLRNMDVDCVDVYYIHNPESQLGHVSTEEFYSRLRLAFERLEQNVANGKIAKYGIATWNGFRVPPTSEGHHSLEKMVEAAKAVGGEAHNFRFIQLPFNLGMPEALNMQNQQVGGEWMSILEAASSLEVTVVSSASIYQGRVAQGLPDHIREPLGSLATDALTAIQFVRSTPGVTTALVGMSHLEHVEENLQIIRFEPASSDDYRKLFGEE
jgi:aryl-alcohol dehydrogenase-like predicted oxidoreductase